MEALQLFKQAGGGSIVDCTTVVRTTSILTIMSCFSDSIYCSTFFFCC